MIVTVRWIYWGILVAGYLNFQFGEGSIPHLVISFPTPTFFFQKEKKEDDGTICGNIYYAQIQSRLRSILVVAKLNDVTYLGEMQ